MAYMDALFTDTSSLIVGLTTFIITYIIYERMDRKRRNLPPGPMRLPIIGTMYAITPSLHSSRTIRSTYGDVVWCCGGNIKAVVLNSHEAIKEAGVLNGRECSDRGIATSFCGQNSNPQQHGFLQCDYHDKLRRNRSSSLTIFRNLGVGRSVMEDKIAEEANTLIEIMHQTNGANFDPRFMLTCSVANVILHVVLNKRHHHDDEDFRQLVKYTEDFVSGSPHLMLIENFNFLQFVPPFKTTLLKRRAASKGVCDYLLQHVEERCATLRSGGSSDFVDAWMQHIHDTQDQAAFETNNFLFILRDFLIAGTETTTTSLKWTLIYMANHTDIQAKVHQEIDRVFGKGRTIRLADRASLPYLEAVIQEIQRFKTILPLSLVHYTSTGVSLAGYSIPADTFLMFNLHGVHMSEESFTDPDVFWPERFIDSNGQFIKHSDVIPFSIGKRSCLGELLARQELFIFTANLMQNFEFAPPDDKGRIDDQGVLGFTHGPKPFKIRAFAR